MNQRVKVFMKMKSTISSTDSVSVLKIVKHPAIVIGKNVTTMVLHHDDSAQAGPLTIHYDLFVAILVPAITGALSYV